MYEFNYSELSQMSLKDTKESLKRLLYVLQCDLNNDNGILSLEEKRVVKNTMKHISSGFNVVINMRDVGEKAFDYSTIDKMIDYSRRLKKPLRVYITGATEFNKPNEAIKMSFSQKAIDNMIELNNYLVDRGEDELYFMEDKTCPENSWTFEEVIKANSYIDGIVEYIKEQNFTPFEAATFIHLYITSLFSYKENEDNLISPRSIVGVLTSDDIVCVGYASLTKAIIDKLKMPGLECSTFASKITSTEESDDVKGIDKNSPTGHMQNLIKIKDTKYKIDGRYVSDACWDSKCETFPSGRGIACFMYPVEDLLHLKGMQFDQFHSHLDEMFQKMGIPNKRIDPYTLPIISKNIAYSKPISYEKYKKSLTQVSLKIVQAKHPKNNRLIVEKKVNKILNTSRVASYLIFDNNAIGSVAKMANKEISDYLKKDKEKELDNAPKTCAE